MRTTSKLVIAVALIAGSTVAASAADGYPGDGGLGRPRFMRGPGYVYVFGRNGYLCSDASAGKRNRVHV